MFPSGMVWDGSAFGTAVTIPAFSWLRGVSSWDSSLASPKGVEYFYTLVGSASRCKKLGDGKCNDFRTSEPVARRSIDNALEP